ncbi:hypothetical protein Esti_001324 [Eimeria stiedai]
MRSCHPRLVVSPHFSQLSLLPLCVEREEIGLRPDPYHVSWWWDQTSATVANRLTVLCPGKASRSSASSARARPTRKRSSSFSAAVVTREAAGLPPQTRPRRRLLTTTLRPPARRGSPPVSRPSTVSADSADATPVTHQPPPFRRVTLHAAAAIPPDLLQWRRGFFGRPPRLNSSRWATPGPARTAHNHMVSIIMQQVTARKRESSLQQTIAAISRHAETTISRQHIQITASYGA